MTGIQRYAKPKTWVEALGIAGSDPKARYLSGGTFLLAGDGRDRPEAVVDLAEALPRGLGREGERFAIGAGTTFQELVEGAGLGGPSRWLAEAALTMMNRNTRNRATVGGNLGADKSCSSLIPTLVVLGAEVETASPASPEPSRKSLEAWLASGDEGTRNPAELLLRIILPRRAGLRAAYRRWSRVSCDLSVLGAAAAYELDGDSIKGLRIALGGLGPKSRRAPDLEALFEGSPLPDREAIEIAASPRLKPITDFRAGADFKRLRGAQLLADALLEARSPEEGA